MQHLLPIEVLDKKMVAIFREKTPAQKVAMVAAAHRTARMLARAGVRHLHPNWSEGQIQAEVLRRLSHAAG